MRPAALSATMAANGAPTRPAMGNRAVTLTPLPKAPVAVESRGVSAQALTERIDAFLASRGFRAASDGSERSAGTPLPARDAAVTDQVPAEFVCEEDVRAALGEGRKLVIGEKTIITPSARDLGDSNKVFVQASWGR